MGTNECGSMIHVWFEDEYSEATISYKVKFDEDYHWTFGGKHAGLCDDGTYTIFEKGQANYGKQLRNARLTNLRSVKAQLALTFAQQDSTQ